MKNPLRRSFRSAIPIFVLMVFAVLTVVQNARAVAYTYANVIAGGGTGTWNTTSNWTSSGGTYPGSNAADTATFSAMNNNIQLRLTSSLTFDSLTMGSGLGTNLLAITTNNVAATMTLNNFTLNSTQVQFLNSGFGTGTLNVSIGTLSVAGGNIFLGASGSNTAINLLNSFAATTTNISSGNIFVQNTTTTTGAQNVDLGDTTLSGGVLALGAQSTAFANTVRVHSLNGSAGTVEINTSGTTSNNATLLISGSDVNNNNYTGTVTNAPGGVGKLSVTKSGSNTQTLGNANNAYTGVTTLSGGTLVATTLSNGGANSSIGKATNAAANIVFDGGTLRYTGAAVNTDRLFTLTNNGGSIDTSGSGAVNFNGSGTVATTGSGNRTLTLTGTSTADNILGTNVVLADASGSDLTSVSKTGTGTWLLNASNTYSGGTTVSNGTLKAGGSSAFGTGALTVNGGTIDLNANNVSVGSLSGSGGTIKNNGASDRMLTVSQSSNGTYAGVIANGTTNKTGLTKSGSNSLILTGTNTYTGNTIVSSGTLIVGQSGSGSLGSTTVSVNSGGTLAGSGTISGGVTVASGGTLSPGNSPGNPTYGTLTLNAGGNYNWQIYDATGLLGTGFDSITVSGALDVTGLSTSTKYAINLWSLSSLTPDTNGNAINFSKTTNQSWLLVGANSITANVGQLATINDYFQIFTAANNGTGGFTNDPGTGVFSLSAVGSGAGAGLYLNFTAVPEPGTVALVSIGLGMIAWRFRKRLRMHAV